MNWIFLTFTLVLCKIVDIQTDTVVRQKVVYTVLNGNSGQNYFEYFQNKLQDFSKQQTQVNSDLQNNGLNSTKVLTYVINQKPKVIWRQYLVVNPKLNDLQQEIRQEIKTGTTTEIKTGTPNCQICKNKQIVDEYIAKAMKNMQLAVKEVKQMGYLIEQLQQIITITDEELMETEKLVQEPAKGAIVTWEQVRFTEELMDKTELKLKDVKVNVLQLLNMVEVIRKSAGYEKQMKLLDAGRHMSKTMGMIDDMMRLTEECAQQLSEPQQNGEKTEKLIQIAAEKIVILDEILQQAKEAVTTTEQQYGKAQLAMNATTETGNTINSKNMTILINSETKLKIAYRKIQQTTDRITEAKYQIMESYKGIQLAKQKCQIVQQRVQQLMLQIQDLVTKIKQSMTFIQETTAKFNVTITLTIQPSILPETAKTAIKSVMETEKYVQQLKQFVTNMAKVLENTDIRKMLPEEVVNMAVEKEKKTKDYTQEVDRKVLLANNVVNQLELLIKDLSSTKEPVNTNFYPDFQQKIKITHENLQQLIILVKQTAIQMIEPEENLIKLENILKQSEDIVQQTQERLGQAKWLLNETITKITKTQELLVLSKFENPHIYKRIENLRIIIKELEYSLLIMDTKAEKDKLLIEQQIQQLILTENLAHQAEQFLEYKITQLYEMVLKVKQIMDKVMATQKSLELKNEYQIIIKLQLETDRMQQTAKLVYNTEIKVTNLQEMLKVVEKYTAEAWKSSKALQYIAEGREQETENTQFRIKQADYLMEIIEKQIIAIETIVKQVEIEINKPLGPDIPTLMNQLETAETRIKVIQNTINLLRSLAYRVKGSLITPDEKIRKIQNLVSIITDSQKITSTSIQNADSILKQTKYQLNQAATKLQEIDVAKLFKWPTRKLLELQEITTTTEDEILKLATRIKTSEIIFQTSVKMIVKMADIENNMEMNLKQKLLRIDDIDRRINSLKQAIQTTQNNINNQEFTEHNLGQVQIQIEQSIQFSAELLNKLQIPEALVTSSIETENNMQNLVKMGTQKVQEAQQMVEMLETTIKQNIENSTNQTSLNVDSMEQKILETHTKISKLIEMLKSTAIQLIKPEENVIKTENILRTSMEVVKTAEQRLTLARYSLQQTIERVNQNYQISLHHFQDKKRVQQKFSKFQEIIKKSQENLQQAEMNNIRVRNDLQKLITKIVDSEKLSQTAEEIMEKQLNSLLALVTRVAKNLEIIKEKKKEFHITVTIYKENQHLIREAEIINQAVKFIQQISEKVYVLLAISKVAEKNIAYTIQTSQEIGHRIMESSWIIENTEKLSIESETIITNRELQLQAIEKLIPLTQSKIQLDKYLLTLGDLKSYIITLKALSKKVTNNLNTKLEALKETQNMINITMNSKRETYMSLSKVETLVKEIKSEFTITEEKLKEFNVLQKFQWSSLKLHELRNIIQQTEEYLVTFKNKLKLTESSFDEYIKKALDIQRVRLQIENDIKEKLLRIDQLEVTIELLMTKTKQRKALITAAATQRITEIQDYLKEVEVLIKPILSKTQESLNSLNIPQKQVEESAQKVLNIEGYIENVENKLNKTKQYVTQLEVQVERIVKDNSGNSPQLGNNMPENAANSLQPQTNIPQNPGNSTQLGTNKPENQNTLQPQTNILDIEQPQTNVLDIEQPQTNVLDIEQQIKECQNEIKKLITLLKFTADKLIKPEEYVVYTENTIDTAIETIKSTEERLRLANVTLINAIIKIELAEKLIILANLEETEIAKKFESIRISIATLQKQYQEWNLKKSQAKEKLQKLFEKILQTEQKEDRIQTYVENNLKILTQLVNRVESSLILINKKQYHVSLKVEVIVINKKLQQESQLINTEVNKIQNLEKKVQNLIQTLQETHRNALAAWETALETKEKISERQEDTKITEEELQETDKDIEDIRKEVAGIVSSIEQAENKLKNPDTGNWKLIINQLQQSMVTLVHIDKFTDKLKLATQQATERLIIPYSQVRVIQKLINTTLDTIIVTEENLRNSEIFIHKAQQELVKAQQEFESNKYVQQFRWLRFKFEELKSINQQSEKKWQNTLKILKKSQKLLQNSLQIHLNVAHKGLAVERVLQDRSSDIQRLDVRINELIKTCKNTLNLAINVAETQQQDGRLKENINRIKENIEEIDQYVTRAESLCRNENIVIEPRVKRETENGKKKLLQIVNLPRGNLMTKQRDNNSNMYRNVNLIERRKLTGEIEREPGKKIRPTVNGKPLLSNIYRICNPIERRKLNGEIERESGKKLWPTVNGKPQLSNIYRIRNPIERCKLTGEIDREPRESRSVNDNFKNVIQKREILNQKGSQPPQVKDLYKSMQQTSIIIEHLRKVLESIQANMRKKNVQNLMKSAKSILEETQSRIEKLIGKVNIILKSNNQISQLKAPPNNCRADPENLKISREKLQSANIILTQTEKFIQETTNLIIESTSEHKQTLGRFENELKEIKSRILQLKPNEKNINSPIRNVSESLQQAMLQIEKYKTIVINLMISMKELEQDIDINQSIDPEFKQLEYIVKRSLNYVQNLKTTVTRYQTSTENTIKSMQHTRETIQNTDSKLEQLNPLMKNLQNEISSIKTITTKKGLSAVASKQDMLEKSKHIKITTEMTANSIENIKYLIKMLQETQKNTKKPQWMLKNIEKDIKLTIKIELSQAKQMCKKALEIIRDLQPNLQFKDPSAQQLLSQWSLSLTDSLKTLDALSLQLQNSVTNIEKSQKTLQEFSRDISKNQQRITNALQTTVVYAKKLSKSGAILEEQGITLPSVPQPLVQVLNLDEDSVKDMFSSNRKTLCDLMGSAEYCKL